MGLTIGENMKIIIISTTILLTIVLDIYGESRIFFAETFKCHWSEGEKYLFQNEVWTKTHNTGKPIEFILDNINLKDKTARIIGSFSGDIDVYYNEVGLLFIQTTESSVNTFIIYSSQDESKMSLFPATHTMNVKISEESWVKRFFYNGYCWAFPSYSKYHTDLPY